MTSVRCIGRSISGLLAALLLASLALSGLHAHADAHSMSTCVVCVASHASADLPTVSPLSSGRPSQATPLIESPRLAPPVSAPGVVRGRAPPSPLA